MLDLGDVVESLEGRYVTAEDVGTGTERHDVDRPSAPRTSSACLPSWAGPAIQARSPRAASRRRCERRCERRSERRPGRSSASAWSGSGHVGARLAERLAAAGAELSVSDIDPAKRELAAPARRDWVEPEDAIGAECDVLAPCALGGAIDAASARAAALRRSSAARRTTCSPTSGWRTSCRARDPLRARLHRQRRGPDQRLRGAAFACPRRLDSLVDGIGEALGRVLRRAREEAGQTPARGRARGGQAPPRGRRRHRRPATLSA